MYVKKEKRRKISFALGVDPTDAAVDVAADAAAAVAAAAYASIPVCSVFGFYITPLRTFIGFCLI